MPVQITIYMVSMQTNNMATVNKEAKAQDC